MLWGAPIPENVGPPAVVRALLEKALAATPDNAILHARLGYLHLDRKDHAAAAAEFEAALRLGDAPHQVRSELARCYNYLHRHADVPDLLATDEKASFERGRALMELGDPATAESEFRAVLTDNPDHAQACRLLCRLLRRSDRVEELVGACEELAARGADNGQLLYNWGWALALAGEPERARRLMFDPERVETIDLPVPAGFADMAAFNDALADEILTNPNKVSEFPVEDEANRGSRRVDNLFTGRRPGLIEQLLRSIENAVAAYVPTPRDGFDPWPSARPEAARLRPWGLVQRGGEYEEGHIHPGGWLSGVYYVRVPSAVSASGDGRGCIEFGPPSRLAETMPGIAPIRRYLPREGMLLLAPSHFQHRTIPSGVDEDRISIAFDVVPDDRPGLSPPS
ncbi:MAG: 2OG-Fe(II) oxygenase family protein [Allosphingosinicella sp.]